MLDYGLKLTDLQLFGDSLVLESQRELLKFGLFGGEALLELVDLGTKSVFRLNQIIKLRLVFFYSHLERVLDVAHMSSHLGDRL